MKFSFQKIIDPNIASLLWIDRIISFSIIELSEIIIIATITTTIIILIISIFPVVVSIFIISLAVIFGNYSVYYEKYGWHRGRESMINKNISAYNHYIGKIYWDKTAEKNDNIVFDQYIAIGNPLRWSNIRAVDIPIGAATIVAEDVRKTGYTCAAKLSYGLVLLVRGTAQTNCGGMDAPPVKLRPSLPVHLSEQSYVRGLGWSHDEPWGRWTDGRSASLHFVLPEASKGQVLEFDVRAYLRGEPPRQRVAVRVNSQTLPDWVFTPETPRQIARIPIPEGARELAIEFELPDARSPQQAGESADPRLLGIGVGAICLTQADKVCLGQ